MPIWRRKSETSYRIIYEETLRIYIMDNQQRSFSIEKNVQRLSLNVSRTQVSSEMENTLIGNAKGDDIVWSSSEYKLEKFMRELRRLTTYVNTTSEFDKFESFLQKCDESLLVHNSCACSAAMEQIRMNFGPFDEDEIQFYKRRLSDGDKCTINGFQRDLLFNLFFKYFGD